MPLSIQIQTNSACNGNCVFCPYPEISRTLEQGVMDEHLYNKIVEEISCSRYPENLIFELHNEPLIDPRTIRMIKDFKTANPNKKCIMATNGLLIDRYSAEEFVNSGIDQIIVSLNAYTNEGYAKVCGLDYSRVCKNIETISAIPELKRKLWLSFVLNQLTAHEITQALSYWKKRDIQTRPLSLFNRAGTLQNYETLNLSKPIVKDFFAVGLAKKIADRVLTLTGCIEPFYHMNILFNGDVILCCHDWNRTTILGNAQQSTLKDIWNSRRAHDVRKLILKKQYSKIPACAKCSVAS